MKKIIALCLSLVLLLGALAGCGQTDTASDAVATGPAGTLEEILENMEKEDFVQKERYENSELWYL